jgi:hypothetical protein
MWNKTKEEKIIRLSNNTINKYMYYKLLPPFELDDVMECYNVHPITNASLECHNYMSSTLGPKLSFVSELSLTLGPKTYFCIIAVVNFCWAYG